MRHETTDDRVLAIMAKAPRAGHVKTRLASAYTPDAIVRLYRALVEDTIDLARSLGLRICAVCPAEDERHLAAWLPRDVEIVAQVGAGLAAGLTFTFDRLCRPPGRRVVAVGGDTPHVPAAVLASAFAALAGRDLVVGPSGDGGYYLVGATRPQPDLFDGKVMGTGSAFDALVAGARRLRLRVGFTETHYDVDLPEDLERLADDLAFDPRRAPRTAVLLDEWGVANRARS